MCIYLWMQGKISEQEEMLYDQNGKKIRSENSNRDNIVSKIFSVSKNSKEIISSRC